MSHIKHGIILDGTGEIPTFVNATTPWDYVGHRVKAPYAINSCKGIGSKGGHWICLARDRMS